MSLEYKGEGQKEGRKPVEDFTVQCGAEEAGESEPSQTCARRLGVLRVPASESPQPVTNHTTYVTEVKP